MKTKIKAKYKRYLIGCAALLSVSVGVLLVLSALERNIVFFYSPSELKAHPPKATERMRVGGLVVEGSVRKEAGSLRFTVTDTAHELQIVYRGVPPALFREGQGVVAEGVLDGSGMLQAEQLLAKHDENYMPPEVADAIRKSGHWKNEVKSKGIQP